MGNELSTTTVNTTETSKVTTHTTITPTSNRTFNPHWYLGLEQTLAATSLSRLQRHILLGNLKTQEEVEALLVNISKCTSQEQSEAYLQFCLRRCGVAGKLVAAKDLLYSRELEKRGFKTGVEQALLYAFTVAGIVKARRSAKANKQFSANIIADINDVGLRRVNKWVLGARATRAGQTIFRLGLPLYYYWYIQYRNRSTNN